MSAFALLCVCEFLLCSAALFPGGSREARRRQRGPPPPRAKSERAGVSCGCEVCGKGIRRGDAGVPGRPLGPDEGEVEE